MTGQDPAIRMLEEQKRQRTQQYEEDMRAIDMAIARLRQSDKTSTGIQPQMFPGLEIADALVVCLNLRGGRATVQELLADMLRGNATIGTQPERRERTIKITITNNKRLFRYDEATEVVELVKAKK